MDKTGWGLSYYYGTTVDISGCYLHDRYVEWDSSQEAVVCVAYYVLFQTFKKLSD